MNRKRRQRLKRALAAALTVVLCFTMNGLPAEAVTAEPSVTDGDANETAETVSSIATVNTVSGGDVQTAKTVNVNFDTSHGEGFYATAEGWMSATGNVQFTVEPGNEFCLEIRTEGQNFISGYNWNGAEALKGDTTLQNTVIRANWEQLSENSDLTIFFDKGLSSEDFMITLSETEGTCGSRTVAALQRKDGVQVDTEGLETIWSGSQDSFAVEASAGAEGMISSCTYLVKGNENREVYATASLYRNGILLATVTSSAFRMLKDDTAPVITEVVYSVNGGNFQPFKENRKIWGFGNITFQVKADDTAENGIISGVRQVSILINGESFAMVWNEERGCYEYTVNRRTGQVFHFNIKFDACDYAGNRVLEEQYPEFGIDDKGPEIQAMLTTGGQEITGWYSETAEEKPLLLEIRAQDHNTVAKVEISTRESFAADSMIHSGIPVWEQDAFVIRTPDTLLTGEQNRTYYIRALDEFGNSSVVLEKQVQIDNTAPSRQVEIGFTGTSQMQVSVSGGDAVSQTYLVEKGQGRIYDNDRIALRLKVSDVVTAGKEENVSGIAQVDFKLVIKNDAGETVLEKHVGEDGFARDAEGNLYVYYEAEVPNGGGSYEQTFQLQDIILTDRAGNSCPADVKENSMPIQDAVLYVMDNQSPQIQYSYDSVQVSPVRVVEGETEKLYYYAQPFTGEIKITDMNLDSSSILAWNLEGYEEAEMEAEALSGENGLWWETGYVFRLMRDGRYRIGASADDILQNAMTEEGVAQCCSHIMIVDTVKPQIMLTMTNDKGQVYDNYGGSYFKENVTAGLIIEEKNLDPDTMKVTISGKTAGGQAFFEEISGASWKQEGDFYSVSYTFSEEGQYSFVVSCADYAGNEASLTSEVFAIDKTIPEVSIVFDNLEAKNAFYYNADRAATVTVRDYSFDADKAEFIVASQYGTQILPEEWIHHGAEGCDGTVHTAACTYTALVSFTQDDIYDFSFVCTDKAGLQSEVCDGGHFVVDKTAPVIRINYSEAPVHNEIFYNTDRTAYINVEDISFSAEGTVIQKMDLPDVNELPAIGSWVTDRTSHQLALHFAEDGTYQFSVGVTDLAGNQSQVEYSEYFILDTLAPSLEIIGVADRSANNGAVQPVIVYGDTYLDDEKVVITLEGANHGIKEQSFTKEQEENGYRISFADFAYNQQTDDLYTLTAKVEDYAGNIKEQSILFSVNRYGSVYVLGEDTKQLLAEYYSVDERDLLITEINVDEVSGAELTYSCDGEIHTLVEGRDYTIDREGSDTSWKSYTYLIGRENFAEEGHYIVTLSSQDAAGNDSDNHVKGMELIFAIDKTAPSIVVDGLEDNGIYQQESRKVTADVQDNMSLEQMAVYVNDQLYTSFDKEFLKEKQGIVSFELEESKGPVDVSIIAMDSAGNEQEIAYGNITVSTDIKILRDAAATPRADGFTGIGWRGLTTIVTLAGIIILISGSIAFVWKRRKRG